MFSSLFHFPFFQCVVFHFFFFTYSFFTFNSLTFFILSPFLCFSFCFFQLFTCSFLLSFTSSFEERERQKDIKPEKGRGEAKGRNIMRILLLISFSSPDARCFRLCRRTFASFSVFFVFKDFVFFFLLYLPSYTFRFQGRLGSDPCVFILSFSPRQLVS